MRLLFQFGEASLDEVEFDHPTEQTAVRELREYFDTVPEIDQGRSYIIPKVTLAKTDKADLETLVIIRFTQPFEHKGYRFNSVSAIFEVKSHRSGIRFRENAIHLKYTSRKGEVRWKTVVRQATDSCYEARSYLRARIPRDVFVVVFPLVYFPKMASYDLADDGRFEGYPSRRFCVFKDELSLESILDKIVGQHRNTRSGNYRYLSAIRITGSSTEPEIETLFASLAQCIPERKVELSRLDRHRIDVLAEQRLSVGRHMSALEDGNDLVLVGRSGTAKTFALLDLARRSMEKGQSVLLSTYNVVLACDIQRLQYLYDRHVKQTELFPLGGWPTVMNIDRLVVTWGRELAGYVGMSIPEASRNYLVDIYEPCKRVIKQAVDDLPIEDVRELLEFDYDYVLIDEGQDWDDEAFAILRKLMKKSARLVFVDSNDQRLQLRRPRFLEYGDYTSIEHRINYRNYDKIRKFSYKLFRWLPKQANPQKIDLDEEALIERDGQIQLIHDDDFTDSLVQELAADLKKDKCLLGDMMVLEPDLPDMDFCCIEGASSQLGRLGYRVWNAHLGQNKKSINYLSDAVRVMNYESCRGLEGWIVVARLIDMAFEISVAKTEKELARLQPDNSTGEDLARVRSGALLSIACSRAVKKLVITYRDGGHGVVQKLRQYLDS